MGVIQGEGVCHGRSDDTKIADRLQSEAVPRFVAHGRKNDGAKQDVWVHLSETADWARQFAEKVGLGRQGELVGILHDLGKATRKFDRYIRSALELIDLDSDDYVDPVSQKGRVDHSTAGAQVAYHRLSSRRPDALWAAQVLALVIASHHSGLIDCITPDGEDGFSRRLGKPDELTGAQEALGNLDESVRERMAELLTDDGLITGLIARLKALRECDDTAETWMFKVGLLVRFLLSCLIDADRLSTANFECPEDAELRNQGHYISWEELIARLERHLEKLRTEAEAADRAGGCEIRKTVAELRREISDQCLKSSSNPKGIYQLTVPTGGGKTLASLRFALNHAREHKMDRIIYVIPYTSIIDQNADTIRGILEGETGAREFSGRIVLEHHSNLTPEKETMQQSLLAENWDAPVVLTTMVQFLDALFGSGTQSVRRMHQLANAVIIFDEIQTLPVRCVHLFNVAVRFLVGSCGSTAVLCTATQPLLDRVEPASRALGAGARQMVPDVQRLYNALRRVEVRDLRRSEGWSTQDVADLARSELGESGSVLIIVNTKKAAVDLFEQLRGCHEARVYHLSTNMCPAHRRSVLCKVTECLKNERPVICVSTQLIEAGVDIDFGTVIRYLAGLDSIAQAAGRCNREGARPAPGRVFIVNPRDENLDKLQDIRTGRNEAERVLCEFKKDPKQYDEDIIGLKAMESYYQYYFYKRKDEMCYPVDPKSEVGRSDSLFELLSTNTLSVEAYKRINGIGPKVPIRQSFMTAARVFQAIDSPARGVVVPYGEDGLRVINELRSVEDPKRRRRLLREAQQYSVNVFPYVFDALLRDGIIHEVQEGLGVYYLDSRYYDDDYGLDRSAAN